MQTLNIIFLDGTRKGHYFLLKEGSSITIGRHVHCHICLNDENVSGAHCTVHCKNNVVIIEDQESTNGTFVNGGKVGKLMLALDDIIEVGKTKFQLKDVIPEEAKKIALKNTVAFKAPAKETGVLFRKSQKEPAFRKTEDKIEQGLHLLHEIGKLVHEKTKIEAMLGAILETILDTIDVERGCIFFKSGASREMTSIFRFRRDKEISFRKSQFPVSSSVLDVAVKHGIGTVSADILSDGRFPVNSTPMQLNIYSIVCVPLQAYEVLGAIYLDSLSGRKSFHQDDLDLLTAIGRQAGLAVERKLADRAIRESEERYRSLVENIDFGITLIDADYNIVMTNAANGKLYGKPVEKFIGKKCFREFAGSDSVCTHCPAITAISSGCPVEVLTEGTRSNGDYFVAGVQIFPTFGSDSEVAGFIEVTKDITPHVQVKNELKKAKVEWQATFDAVSDLIVITDQSGKIRRCNLSADKYFQKNAKKLIGRDIEEVFPGREKRTSARFELNMQNDCFDVSCSTLKLEGKDGFVYTLRNITRRKALEVGLRNSSKLAVLGLLASGIAHELGNPLSFLSARLQRLKVSRKPEFVEKSLDLFDSQVSRMSRILQKISSFSRPPSEELIFCDIGAMLQETVELLKLNPHSKITKIQLKIERELPRTLLFKDQLQQAFINIGINALDAMPEGGVISIAASCDQREFSISFADTGTGIAPEIREQIFEPFFSTKEAEKGIGLGLYLTVNYVQANSGSIEVQSEPGKGTKFTIRFPLRKHD